MLIRRVQVRAGTARGRGTGGRRECNRPYGLAAAARDGRARRVRSRAYGLPTAARNEPHRRSGGEASTGERTDGRLGGRCSSRAAYAATAGGSRRPVGRARIYSIQKVDKGEKQEEKLAVGAVEKLRFMGEP